LYARTERNPVTGTSGYFGGSPSGHEPGDVTRCSSNQTISTLCAARPTEIARSYVFRCRAAVRSHYPCLGPNGGRAKGPHSRLRLSGQYRRKAQRPTMLCIVRRTFRSSFSTDRNERFSSAVYSEHFRLSRKTDGWFRLTGRSNNAHIFKLTQSTMADDKSMHVCM